MPERAILCRGKEGIGVIFNTGSILWLALFVAFLILEGVTAGLVTIWFAAGALAALIAQLLGGAIWLQILLFCLVSTATILLVRPAARKLLNRDRQATNADRLFEMVGIVQEQIDNVAATGLVKVDGKVWTARSMTEEPIARGALVQAKRIEGVKLIVVPLREETAEDTAQTVPANE